MNWRSGWIAGLLLLLPVANALAGTRIALLAGDDNDVVAKIVTLAEVKLSQEPGLDLLDRESIRRVVEEHWLSLDGVVDSGQAIVAGKLLTVDLFAVLQATTNRSSEAGLIVFDARTGARYADEAIAVEEASLDRAVEAVVKMVRISRRKQSSTPGELRTVSLVGVRNADLPRDQDRFCDAIGYLLERSLPRSAQVAVLERRQLGLVNEEQALPTSDAAVDLIPSLVTIDLEISRAVAGSGLKATAILKRGKSSEVQTITVTAEDPGAAKLTNLLANRLLEVLQVTAPENGLLTDHEASRFDAEAAHHFSHRQFDAAVRRQDAAVALAPQNEVYAQRLSTYLISHAEYLYSPQYYHWNLGDVERRWAESHVKPETLQMILRQATRSVAIQESLSKPFRIAFNNNLERVCHRLRGLRLRSGSAEEQQQIDLFLQLCRKRSVEYCERQLLQAQADPRHFDAVGGELLRETPVLCALAIDSALYAEVMQSIAGRWVSITRNWRPEMNQTDGGEALNLWLETIIGTSSGSQPLNDADYTRRMQSVFTAMQQHNRPIVRLYGLLGEIRSDVLNEKISRQAGQIRFSAEYRKLAQSIIADPSPWHAERTRFAVYEAWGKAIGALSDSETSEFNSQEAMQLCQFMAERREIHRSLFQALVRIDRTLKPSVARQMLDVVESTDFRGTPEERRSLREPLLALATRAPEAVGYELTGLNAVMPWSRSTRLFDTNEFRELSDIDGLTLVGNFVYAICLQFHDDQTSLRMVRIPIGPSRPELMTEVDVGLAPSTVMPFRNNRHVRAAGQGLYRGGRIVTSICHDDAAIYVSTRNSGILIFPRNGSPVRRLNVDNGLPSNAVLSVAVLEGKLYAGMEDGYLIAADLQSDQIEVLASSRRKQKRSPLDDRASFRVTTVIGDVKRRRLLFAAASHLWQYSPASGEVRSVFDLSQQIPAQSGRSLPSESICWTSPIESDRVLISDSQQVIAFNLWDDTALMLPRVGTMPFLILDEWLWSGNSFTRHSLETGQRQALTAPDRSPIRFPATFLDQIGKTRRIIAADEESVWALDISEDSAGVPAVGSTAAPAAAVPPESKPQDSEGSTAKSGPSKAPPAPATIRAVIVTEDGTRLNDGDCAATFTYYQIPRSVNGELQFGAFSPSTVIPKDGKIQYSFVSGHASLAVTAAGYAPFTWGIQEIKPGESVDLGTITLRRGFPWKIRVLARNDAPIAQAQVRAYCRFDNALKTENQATTLVSDTEGFIEWPHATMETYTVSIRAKGFQTAAKITLKPTADQPSVIKLIPSQPSTGLVIDEAGNPVVGAAIRTRDAFGPVLPSLRELSRTDHAGRFTIDQLVDGIEYTAMVDVDRKTRLLVTNLQSGQTDQIWKLQSLVHLAGKIANLPPGHTRRFSYMNGVSHHRGQSFVEAIHGEANLDADGNFRINDLLPGTVRLAGFGNIVEVPLKTSKEDYVLNVAIPATRQNTSAQSTTPSTPAPAVTQQPVRQENSVTGNIARVRCPVQVTLATSDGTSIDDQSVKAWITAQTNPTTVNGKTVYSGSSGTTASCQSGVVKGQISPGLVSIGLLIPGFAPLQLEPREAIAGKALDFGTVKLSPGFPWMLKIEDEDGKPIPNAALEETVLNESFSSRLFSDSSGQALIKHAAEIPYRITVTAHG